MLYRDDRKWELQVPVHDTTEAVEFEAKGTAGDLSGIRFEHDDAVAEGGTTYAASCKLEPIGDWSADERNVFAKFAHVRERANGASTATQAQRPLGDLDQAWDVGSETDQAAANKAISAIGRRTECSEMGWREGGTNPFPALTDQLFREGQVNSF